MLVAATAGALLLCWYLRRKKNYHNQRTVPFQPFKAGEGHKLLDSSFFCSSPHFEDVAGQLEGTTNTVCAARVRMDSTDVDRRAAFWARGLLSPTECAAVIRAAEATGFKGRKFEGKGKDSASCVVWSPALAAALYSRLLTMQEPPPRVSYFDSSPGVCLDEVDFDTQDVKHWGEWVGVNPSVRVERYNPDQHLKIHRDGAVLIKHPDGFDTQTYTVHAVLVYLNTSYEAGMTDFVISRVGGDHGGYKFGSVKGAVGDGLIFRHEFLHRGGTVSRGTKYILRLDLAYQLT